MDNIDELIKNLEQATEPELRWNRDLEDAYIGWGNVPDELSQKAAACIRQLRQQNAELLDALKTVHIWVVRWTGHVGRCDGGLKCTCGRTRAIYEAEAALAKETGGE